MSVLAYAAVLSSSVYPVENRDKEAAIDGIEPNMPEQGQRVVRVPVEDLEQLSAAQEQ